MNQRVFAAPARRGLSIAASGAVARMTLAISDVAALAIALSIAVGIRVSILPRLSAAFQQPTYPPAHYFELWWLPLVYLAALWHAGLYTRRDPYWEEVRRCLSGVTVAAVLIFAILSLAKLGDNASRPVVVLTWAVLLMALPFLRRATKQALVALGPWRQPALIVGRGAQVALLRQALTRDRTLGYEIVEVIADPRLAPERALVVGARDVILSAPQLDRAEFLRLVERLRDVAENVIIAPDLAEVPVLGVEVLGLFEDRVILLRVPNNLLRPWNVLTKRGFDLVAGGVLALLSLPLLAVAAVAIKLTSPGPVFHAESRVGRRHVLFPCYKLRTMYRDADERLQEYLALHPDAAAEWQRYWKLRGPDPRVTRAGAWLRRYSLDEVPQVFNVLRGEMSLVGPRPYLPRELPLLDGDAMLDVRPGMTGLWQVSGKNALEYTQRVKLDRWYVSNWSLWLDVMILAKSVPAVLRGE